MKAETLAALRAARQAKRPIALVTALSTGAQALVDGGEVTGELRLPSDVLNAAQAGLQHDQSGTLEHGNDRYFIHAFNPPLRLVIVGAVHIAQTLARMALLAGYAVVIVDPRGSFATEDRFPGITLMDDWPDDALQQLHLDSRTAVVTLTHDPKLDDPALMVALRSPVFYIGSLGSRKTNASRGARLREAGYTDAEIGRIHGPIGLPLGGRQPAEIALAIVAEMTQVLHGGKQERAA